MRYLFGFLCVCALGTVSLVGCGQSLGPTGGSGGTAGDGGTGGLGGSGGSAGTGGMAGGGNVGGQGGGEIATLQILPVEGDDGVLARVAGVRICELDTDNCAVSDGTSNVLLDMPVNEEVSYTMVKEGYRKSLRSDVLGPGLTLVVPYIVTDALESERYEQQLMSPYPMQGNGAVSVSVWASLVCCPIPGATAQLVEGTGKIYYTDEDQTYRTDLTATTSGGPVGFYEVPPGEIQVKIGGAVKDCEVVRGWPGDEPNAVRVLVREDFTTEPRFLCSVE